VATAHTEHRASAQAASTTSQAHTQACSSANDSEEYRNSAMSVSNVSIPPKDRNFINGAIVSSSSDVRSMSMPESTSAAGESGKSGPGAPYIGSVARQHGEKGFNERKLSHELDPQEAEAHVHPALPAQAHKKASAGGGGGGGGANETDTEAASSLLGFFNQLERNSSQEDLMRFFEGVRRATGTTPPKEEQYGRDGRGQGGQVGQVESGTSTCTTDPNTHKSNTGESQVSTHTLSPSPSPSQVLEVQEIQVVKQGAHI
jgi:hypothetical protein